MLNWFLLLVPVSVLLEFLYPTAHVWIFAVSALAIFPLAGWMGLATEELANHTGEGVGGLLNATFGNAADLVIMIVALKSGLYDIVKAALAGAIIGNILLVLGVAMIAGGSKFNIQSYNPLAAQSQTTMLALGVIALMMLAILRLLGGDADPTLDSHVSLVIACVLLTVYALNLLFQLFTHKRLFAGESTDDTDSGRGWSAGRAILVLAVATFLIAWISESLVGSIEPTTRQFGLNSLFVGVFLISILGNASELATAVRAARNDRMDLSLSIAVGSSVQVVLFLAPLLVLLSQVIGPRPMDLMFRPGLVFSVFFAVWVASQVASNGESHWLKGAQLLAIYVILGVVFFYAPIPEIPAGIG